MKLKSLATHHIKLAGVHREGYKNGTDRCDRDNMEEIHLGGEGDSLLLKRFKNGFYQSKMPDSPLISVIISPLGNWLCKRHIAGAVAGKISTHTSGHRIF